MLPDELIRSRFTLLYDKACSTPVLGDELGFSRICAPGRRADVDIQGYWAYLERVFRVPTYNPRDANRNDAIRSLYVLRKDSGDPGTLPSLEAFEHLHQLICKARTQTIIVKGRRGSGKTNAINFYLSQYFPKLCNLPIPVTFFRADVAKLYAKNALLSPDKWVGVQEYMEAHAYYVVLKYADQTSVDRVVALFAQELDADSPFRRWLAVKVSSSKAQALINLWDSVVAEFRDRHTDAGDEFSIKIVQDILRPVEKLARLLHKEFISFMQHLGDTGAKSKRARVIKIVDAIDNVRQFTDRTLYKRLLRELQHYRPVGQERPKQDYDLAILAMRPETITEFSALMPVLPSVVGGDEHILQVVPANFPDLIATKRQFSDSREKSTISELFGHDEDLDIADKGRFTFYSRYLISALEYAAPPEKLGVAQPKPDNKVEYLFYDNLRSLSRNVVRAAQYLERYRMSVHSTPMDDREWMRKHSRLLIEGSVLAGSENFPTNFEDDLKGRWCPNFFEFMPGDGVPFWGGLTLLRILQLSGYAKGTYSEKTIARILGDVLGYPEDQVSTAFSVAHEFALIERGDPLIESREQREQQGRIEYTHGVQPTRKGEYVKHLAFSNATVAYLMALTTPMVARRDLLPGSQLTWRHVYFGELKAGVSRSRRFHESALRTLVFLLRHVNDQHGRDMRHQPSSSTIPASDAVFKRRAEIFALPRTDQLGSDCFNLFSARRALYATTKAVTDDLLEEWRLLTGVRA